MPRGSSVSDSSDDDDHLVHFFLSTYFSPIFFILKHYKNDLKKLKKN
jgi:hypothetical protein